MSALWRLAALALACLAFATVAKAEERILFFRSEVRIEPDASLAVTETIRVQVEGREIRRGILRDFPTRYRDRSGAEVRVGFDVAAVERDGRAEPWALEGIANGERIRIGDKDVLLPAGPHEYRITYRTTRQLGFFDGYDELYWNVTGNAWTFTIDQTEAVITLPDGAPVVQHAGYTGEAGAQGQDFRVTQARDGRFIARTTRPLARGEGFTIAVAWPKGHVAVPGRAQRLGWLVHDNAALALAGSGLLLVLCYYLILWWRVGRDPARGVVIPLFAPPAGISPAAARFLVRQGFDDATFAAGLVDLAVKGRLKIRETEAGYELLRQDGANVPLGGCEAALATALFAAGSPVELEQKNHKRLGRARDALKEALASAYEGTFFRTNRYWFWGGAALSALVLWAAVELGAPGEDEFGVLVMMAFTAGWWAFVLHLLRQAARAWRTARGLSGQASALFASLFAIPFVLGGLLVPALVVWQVGSSYALFGLAVLAALIGLANLVFYHLLKAPTPAGRKILDQLAGFRLYLATAEEERLAVLHPPERTPELFERYLPYALALGCAHAWSRQFAGVLATAGAPPPSWYEGDSWDSSHPSSFADHLGGRFSASTAAAATAPGSSSGSGGGGSSGGGGGGGGGSGW